jgi:hypothetical protein
MLQNIFPSANSEICSSPRDYVANCVAYYVANAFRQFFLSLLKLCVAKDATYYVATKVREYG